MVFVIDFKSNEWPLCLYLCFLGEALSSKETDLEDIVIVKRETQVVRAIEPRTGSEKWNFSVSTHHLTFQPGKEWYNIDLQ